VAAPARLETSSDDPLASNVRSSSVATSERFRADGLFDSLFPLCRSITGPGIQQTLAILSEVLPLELVKVPSGSQIFDWTVPDEWHVRDARLTGPDGKVYADFRRTNLSIVNFSTGVDRILSLEELRPHLHSIPTIPDAIPYVTSYYKRTWGFCLAHEELERMPPGRYHAHIDAEHRPGHLVYGHTLLYGKTDREVLLTSYACHPSLANNELSGPIVLALLYARIAAWPSRRYTYRFVIAPETIGSIAYLSRYGQHLRGALDAGLVLTCIGGPNRRLSYKTTRREDSLIDRTVLALKKQGDLDVEIRPFIANGGSDERQYNSPGFNLPVGQMARSVYKQYEGYHNSLDTKAFMGINSLLDSVARLELLLKALEGAGRFRNLLPFGEVQLGRRGLYPNTNSPALWGHTNDTLADNRVFLNRMMTVLNYSDGEHDMIDIAERCGCKLQDLAPVIACLEDNGLLELAGEHA
jgi:aminopeptidase-like protein